MNEKSSCPVLRGRDDGNIILLLDHMAVSHDGELTHILNGRLLRSKVQYRNKLLAELNSRIDGRMKKGSKRRKRVIGSKKRQLKKIEHQIKDIEHQQTTKLITTLYNEGVQTVVIGDVRAIRQDSQVTPRLKPGACP